MRKALEFLKRHAPLKRHALAATLALTFGAANAIAQGAFIAVQNGVASGPSIYGDGDAKSGLYFGTGFVGATNHFVTGSGGAAPTVTGTNCGSGVNTGSTDDAGGFTNGTATSGCTIVFGHAYTTIPSCIVQDISTQADSGGYTVTTAHIALGTTVSADKIVWLCKGSAGG